MAELTTLGAVIKPTYEGQPDTNAFDDAAAAKLAGIEVGATTDPTAAEILAALLTVDGAGSLLDADKLDGNEAAAFATAAQGATASAALPKAGGQMSGNITMAGPETVDGRDLSVDGSKLDGIEAAADVTDTANVTAAGALMDSEVTNLAQVKAFSAADYATAAQGATADAALPAASYTAADVLTKTKTVDGTGSGLDADLLDGNEATAFATAAHTHEGTGILSTGEAGGTKFLREDGDGTSSWQAVPGGSGDFKADGSVDMTGEFRTDVGTYDSDVANGASAVGHTFDTANTYSTAGANLLRLKNNGTVILDVSFQGGIDFVASGASTAGHSQSLNLNWAATGTQAASGQYSAVIGNNNTASQGSSMAFGVYLTASGYGSGAFAGAANTVSGQYAVNLGGEQNVVSGTNTVCMGKYAVAALPNTFVIGADYVNAAGQQVMTAPAKIETTDATPTNLNVLGSRFTVPADTTWGFSALITARSNEAGGNDSAIYRVEGGIARDESNNTALVGSVTVTTITESAGASAWDVTAEADDTNEALAIKVTGAAATTIRWVAKVDISQVVCA